MMRPTPGFALRLAALAVAFVIGPATLAPGTAEAPRATSALAAGDASTAAQRYQWRLMQWDYAWEFGEDLDSRAYRGQDTGGGRWLAYGNGTGRVAKYGGGIEFHSGERYAGSPDVGDTRLTLQGKATRLGRWELRERFRFDRWEPKAGVAHAFVVELVPEGTGPEECPAYSLTIARTVPGKGAVRIGVNSGRTAWSKTLTGYNRRAGVARLHAVQVTGRRITWFVNGRAVASLAARAAIPKVPLTVRMSSVGKGTAEMKKSVTLIDWVRNYDLKKGKRTPRGAALNKGPFRGC